MFGIADVHAIQRRSLRSPFPLLCTCSLLLFCLLPYLLDVATSEEWSTPSVHQPVLVDGEEVELLQGPNVHSFAELTLVFFTSSLKHSDPPTFQYNEILPVAFLQNTYVVLASRPPPLA